jgi:hypothetical protein
MRKRIYIILLLPLALLVWLFLHRNRQIEPSAALPSAATATNGQGETTRKRAATAASAASSSVPAPPVQNGAAVVENRINQVKADIEQGYQEWKTPIEFYGKVIDENTNSVSDANVHFVWTDLSPLGNSEAETTSDGEGLFSLKDVSGKHLIVQVSKPGYYSYQPFGAAFFYAGENQNFVPDAASPVVFRLKKKGIAEPLVHVQAPMGGPKGFRIAKDGAAVEVSLATGTTVPLGQGDLRIQCWTSDQTAPGQKYAWKCQVSVPNGGLLETSGGLDFEAPLNGYLASDVIDMSTNLESDSWSSQATRTYFLRLANGTYARTSFQIIAGGDHFFQIESFLNPSGSRNLEFDPNTVAPSSN